MLRPNRNAFTPPGPWLQSRLLPILILGLFSVAEAQADLLEYSFTAASGEVRTLKPGAQYANPAGAMELALNAGVDRRIRASIVPASGETPISSATSHILGAGDRITVDGSSHYGARLQLPAPPEGRYRIKAEILSSDGKDTVQVDYYPLTVDVTPPAAGMWALSNKTFGTPYGWETGTSPWHAGCEGSSNSNIIQRTGMTDQSGVARARAESFIRGTSTLAGQLTLQAASDGTINAGDMCGLFPTGYQREYTVKWHVTDNAGNTRVVTQDMFWDSQKTPPQPYAVYQPGGANDGGFTDFQAYAPGMKVQANPLKVIFKIPDSDWHETAKGGLTVLEKPMTLLKRSGGFHFLQAECFIGNPTSCGRFADQTSWGLGYVGATLQVVLGENATVPPQLKSVEYNYSDIGWGSHSRRVPSPNLPVTVSGIRVTVEPRPYTQRVVHTQTGGTCNVAANQSSCVVPWSFTMNRGTWGYIHGCCVAQGFSASYAGPALPKDSGGPVIVYKDDDTRFATPLSYPVVSWNDLVKPVLDKVAQPLPNGLDATVVYAPEGGLQKQLGMQSIVAKAAGKTFTGATLSVSGDSVQRTARFALSGLADGSHAVQVVMTDLHGNAVTSSGGTVLIDTTGPAVAISAENTISSLDSVRITVSDAIDAAPSLKSIVLTGGPAKENVSLAWTKVSGNTYRLEYPILFPSLVEGEGYQLVVTAADAHGNGTTSAKSFVYSPEVTVLESAVPSVPFEFKSKSGAPAIRSQPLRLATGEVLSGGYELYVTLRSDATSAFSIGGKQVAPGATVTLPTYNFTATGGRLELSAWPLKAGAVGINGVLISTSAPNSPVVVANIETWAPKVSVSRTEESPRQVLTQQTLALVSEVGNRCQVTTDESLARSTDPLLGPYCFLEWTSIPAGLKEVPDYSDRYALTKLQGAYQDGGAQVASYTLSLFAIDGSRRVIGQGSDTVMVLEPQGATSFAQSLEGKTILRAVDVAKLTFQQSGAPTCEVTSDAALARAAGMNGGPLTCLLEITNHPAGLQLKSQTPPEFEGTIMTSGRHPLTWTASVFDASGKKLVLQEGASVIDVVHPEVTTTLVMRVQEGGELVSQPTQTFPQAWTDKAYDILSEPAHGSVVATTEGFRYQAEPGYVGPDSFRYRVTDISGMHAEAEASVEIVAFNYPPVVRDVQVRATRMISTSVRLQAEDPNAWDSHSFEIVSPPEPSTVRLKVTGDTLLIEPIDYWHGTARFTYRAVDLAGVASEPATIELSIPLGDKPPVVIDRALSVQDNKVGSLTLSATDPDSPQPVVFEVVAPADNVTASISGRTLSVKSNNRWHGQTSLTYRAQDDGGLWSAPATVRIEITKSLESEIESGDVKMLIMFKVRGL